MKVKPNKVHEWIYNIENILGKDVKVITQNIDGLHQKAGSQDVIDLHGTSQTFECPRCHQQYSNVDILNLMKDNVPYCRNCKAILKPSIVLFGEDIVGYSEALKAVKWADTMLILGTRLEVYPANTLVDKFYKELVRERKYKGSTNRKMLLWNNDKTLYDKLMNELCYEDFNHYLK